MDFKFKHESTQSSYWTVNFCNVQKSKPVFMDEINTKNLTNSETNKYVWLNFLQDTNYSNTNPSNNQLLQAPYNTPLTSTLDLQSSQSYKPLNTVNVNFLRYERLYTKLKYSRSPAFDIVSGGAAAMLAGFLGFLISEKFGFELVDSGDFYYLFMYVVFASFMLKPLLYIANVNNSILETLSYRHVINFITKLFLLFIRNIKNILKI